MKFFALVLIVNFILFSRPATAGKYVFASHRTAEQIQLARDADSKWIANSGMTAAQGFTAILKLMNEDQVVHSFMQKIMTQLQSHGVHQLEDVVKICPSDNSTASGYTNFSIKIVEVRPKFPSQAEIPWSNVALEAMREAFSYRIISKPFMEYLVVQSLPTVCVKSDESIQRAYSIFVHEFVHFSQQDPFQDVVPKDTFDIDDYLTSMILRVGGELDAFKMQVSAEVRLLGRMGILNPNVDRPFEFASLNGEIIDVEGLRNYIFSTYKTVFDTDTIKSNLAKSVYANNIYRSAFLKQGVIPILTNHNDVDTLNAVQTEITKIEEANAILKAHNPDLL